jgi:uncharacterized protein involved in response to NO
MNAWRLKGFSLLALFTLFVGASNASACAVCFGAKGDPVTEAISQSILFMLGLLVVVLGGIVAFFARIIIRSSRMAVPDEEVLAIVQPKANHLIS